MKKIFAIACFAMTVCIAYSQEFKIAKSTGRLEISEVNNVLIEGTTGNEIIFVSRDNDRDDDDRAKGLRAVSASGLEDNTGIGLSVSDKGHVVEVRQLKKMDGPDVTIKVPKGVVVSFSHTSPHGDRVEFRGFEGEIEVSTVHSGVLLDNTPGLIKINTVHGDIDAMLSTIKNPVSLVSVHGHVDAAIPATTKSDLDLDTKFGEIFVDPDFKIERNTTGNMVRYSDNLTGKINGGGTNIRLSSTHNNVYLRKTK